MPTVMLNNTLQDITDRKVLSILLMTMPRLTNDLHFLNSCSAAEIPVVLERLEHHDFCVKIVDQLPTLLIVQKPCPTRL